MAKDKSTLTVGVMKNPYEGSLDEHMAHVFGYATHEDWELEIMMDSARDMSGHDLAWPSVAFMGTGSAGIREAFRLTVEEVYTQLIGGIGLAGCEVEPSEKRYLARVERSRWRPDAWDAAKHHRTWWLQDPRRPPEEPYACIVERIMELHHG